MHQHSSAQESKQNRWITRHIFPCEGRKVVWEKTNHKPLGNTQNGCLYSFTDYNVISMNGTFGRLYVEVSEGSPFVR